ncbi:uncharacterized protein N7479_011428 [Penicillium vulpinum]|uniref:uncharacterized protein n=1 Tax=Penicillium vulpinum TaxID=29845 RepID=UPI0025472D22|nr:uncharacterized protein N7479_011428 [Penicillium vulpinum]KAJ5953015.1 hypothetical protein N7479_011428 [Penicillium vulpinum]
MDRPRRAAAQKPEGHYALTSPTKKRKTRSEALTGKKDKKNDDSDEDSMSKNMPSSAPQKKGKQKQSKIDPIAEDTLAPGTIPVILPEPLDPVALALDLKVSYESRIPPPPVRPKRQTRWQRPATNPIVYMEDLPKGFNYDEPDLDPEDLEAQIARCYERISDNIVVGQFQIKLNELLGTKKHRE